MENVEVYPKIQVDEGEVRNQVIFGGVRAGSFIKDVVAGKTVDGRKYSFDDELVMEIHDRVTMAPGIKGFLRQTDSTTVGGEPVRAHFENLPNMMRLFGRWLEEEMEGLRGDPENIVRALQAAAGAHYGIVAPDFHPFDNGNGRTARALMNLVLMSQSYELTAHGLAIPPIPIVRTDKDSGHYIRSLRAVDESGMLNSLMAFIAQKWIESLDERLKKIHEKVQNPQNADKLLVQKLETRRELLKKFVKSGVPDSKKGNYQSFPVPDYFSARFVRLLNVETL